jgi:exodeoxyribonuclease VII large subunit
VTIADLVADLRAPTPSAAAEAVVPDRSDIARNLQRDGWRLSRGIATQLGRAQERVQFAREDLASAGGRLTELKREQVRIAARQLEALSPLAGFARGYAIPLSSEGRILRTGADFVPGGEFDLRVRDGVVNCRTIEVNDL